VTGASAHFAPAHVPAELAWDHSLAEFTSELDDPFLAASRLLDGPPLFWARDALHGRPGWVIARHDLLKQAFLDWERFSSAGDRDLATMLGVDWDLNPVRIDPPMHTIYRKVLTPFFTPKAVAHMEAGVRETCDELIARFADRGGCDFVKDFAVPFPSIIFLRLMGLPLDMMEQFFGWEQDAWPASGLVPLGNEGRFYNKATSLAAYLQTEYKFNDQLELVAGARITRDKKSSRFRWDSLVNGVVVPRAPLVPPVYKKTKPNYLVGLNWTPNDDTLVYGKFSTSFVSGGSVAGITFVPETAKSWEIGVKADMLDRRLRANLALFDVNYKNFQQPSATTSPEAVAFLSAAYGELGRVIAPNLGTFVQQAHDVHAKGFELELTAAPTDGLTLGSSLSYTKAKFTNITPVFLAAQGGSYEAFIRPKWTGSAFAAYETRPLMDNMTLLLRLDGVYRSKLAFSGNPAIQIARGVPVEQLSSPGHWKFNGRVALRNIALGGMEAELAAWGRNLTDKRYAASSLYLPWGQAATYDTGRTYGLDLTIQF